MIGNLGKWFWFADQTESAVGALAGKDANNENCPGFVAPSVREANSPVTNPKPPLWVRTGELDNISSTVVRKTLDCPSDPVDYVLVQVIEIPDRSW
jgi:hypothetical protein